MRCVNLQGTLKDKNTKNLQVSTKTQADSFYLYLLII